jgi:O-antigen biosynthesis protein WbqP
MLINKDLDKATNAPTPASSASRLLLGLKRATDLSIAGTASLLLLPLLGLVAVAICVDSPGSPLFSQRRVGKNGKLFDIYKFRTMRIGTPNVATELMVKMERSPITRVGAILRKTSLDELPQLLNVIKGEMSLVGPRPALFNQYELTEMRAGAGALSMAPGITGWAQINGRDELTDQEKVAFDAWYCSNWTYGLDWLIILRTFSEVFRQRGAL